MQIPDTRLNVAYTSTDWRGVALSNFSLSPFVFDDQLFASVEGFIQGLKFPEGGARREQAFQSCAWAAKKIGEQADNSDAYWAGASMAFGSTEHHRSVGREIGRASVRERVVQYV